jgi:threonine dehydratase
MIPVREFLSRYMPRTPLVEAAPLGPRVYLKVETGLPTGSFKVRGALWGLAVARDVRPAMTEVAASSTGNHGAAVAWAAQQLGLRATIFLPRHPNPVKKANIVQYGATVVEVGKDLTEASEAAFAHTARTGAFFLNDATDPHLIDGPGTIADEILEDLPDTAVIYVPVGDTALIRGVARRAKALKPSIRIVGVQAERAPSYYLSWKTGVATPTDTADTIADGLATRTPDAANVEAIRALVDDMRLVSEEAMRTAIERLARELGVVAEPAAASTVAAYACADATEAVTVLLITGKNLSPGLLAEG